MDTKKYWRKEATQSVRSLADCAKREYENGIKWIVLFDKDRWMVIVLYDESLAKDQISNIETRVNNYIKRRDIDYYMKIVYGILKKVIVVPDQSGWIKG